MTVTMTLTVTVTMTMTLTLTLTMTMTVTLTVTVTMTMTLTLTMTVTLTVTLTMTVTNIFFYILEILLAFTQPKAFNQANRHKPSLSMQFLNIFVDFILKAARLINNMSIIKLNASFIHSRQLTLVKISC